MINDSGPTVLCANSWPCNCNLRGDRRSKRKKMIIFITVDGYSEIEIYLETCEITTNLKLKFYGPNLNQKRDL